MPDNKEVKKKIFESSSLSVIFLYLSYIINIINTFLIVRLISPEEWGLLLLAISFLNFAVFLTSFIPPSAQTSINFYIPQLLAEKEKTEDELVSFVYYNYKNRFFFSLLIYIIFCIIILLSNFETQTFQIIMVLSPLILINTFQNLNISLLLAFQKFKRVFLINMLNLLIKTMGYIIIFYFQLGNPLILLTSMNIIQGISCFSIALFSIIPLVKIKRKTNHKLNYKDYKKNFQELQKNFALSLTISSLISQFVGVLINILYVNSGMIIFITYISVCEHAIGFIVNTSSSKQASPIFSQLYKENKPAFKHYIIKYLKYASLANAVMVGFMFSFIEIYIGLVYIEAYFILITIIQFYVILTFSRLILRTLGMISSSTNNTKIILQLNIFQVSFNILSVILVIIFSSFELLIFLLIISSYLATIVSFILINHYTSVDLKIRDIYKPVLLFLPSFFIAFFLSFFINIKIFGNFIFIDIVLNSSIKFLIFLIVLYLTLYLTRYITQDEFDNIIEIIPILRSKNKYIQKIVNTIKFFFPTEKKEDLAKKE